MKNEVDSFLDGLDNEIKTDPFVPDTETFETKETKVEEVKSEDKEEKVPFNKDPKIQKYIDKQISKRMADIKPTETERFVSEVSEDDPLADVLSRIIGNDTPEKLSAIKDFKNALGGMKEDAKREALSEIQARSDEERQEEINAQRELASAFDDIEENFDIDITSNDPKARKTRSEFVDFITRIAPKDEDGQVMEFPDFNEAFTLFQEMKKPEPNNRAKELASRSMARSTDASVVKPNDDKSWKAVDRMFSKLSN